MSEQKITIKANKDKQDFFWLVPLVLFTIFIVAIIGLAVSGFLLTPFLAIPIILFVAGCITGAIWLANRKKTLLEIYKKPDKDFAQNFLSPANNNQNKPEPYRYSEILSESTGPSNDVQTNPIPITQVGGLPESDQLSEQQKNSAVPNFDPSEEFSAEKISSFLKASYGKTEIPNNTFLIWFGKEIPTKTKSGKNYLNNLFEHKRKNPDTNVSLVISKKLMEEKYYNELLEQCKTEGVNLIDFDNELKNLPNYDIVQQFLDSKKIKAPEKYILASDILRFSLLYQSGGRYFDTDLVPQKPYHKVSKKNSRCLDAFSTKSKTFGSTFITSGRARAIAMDSFIATKEHFLFILFMTAARYYGEKALNFLESMEEKDDKGQTVDIISLIMQTTGYSIVGFGNLLWKLSEDKDANKNDMRQNNDAISSIYNQQAYLPTDTRDTTGESVLPTSEDQKLFLDNIHKEITENSDKEPFAYEKFMLKKAYEYGYLKPTEPSTIEEKIIQKRPQNL